MRRALTLLELLVVVAILATLAGTVLVSQGGVEDRAHLDIARHELQNIREAVLRFRQDTGFLPKQGPYALASQSPSGEVPTPVGTDPADYAQWFNSPANLIQLYENPLADAADPREWDPDLRRGWKGPYLGSPGREVSIGEALTGDGSSGMGADGTQILVVPGLADPFARAPVAGGPGVAFRWTTPSGELSREGRPYFLFSLDSSAARVVSCGLDGAYTPHSVDPAAPAPVAATNPDGTPCDDIGLFLHQ